MAQLMHSKRVDRVLTTNFDTLLTKACHLVGLAPAIYDTTTSPVFEPDSVYETAIFHLHGVHTGFLRKNTAAATNRSRRSRPIPTWRSTRRNRGSWS